MLISLPQIVLEFAAFSLILATMAFAVQAAAALLLSDRQVPVASLRPSIAVLIPAHNEEQNIEATLIQIKEELSPADRLLVVADSCTDRTTALATRTGGPRVAVLDDQHRVHYRTVQLGRDWGATVEVSAGLKAGEERLDDVGGAGGWGLRDPRSDGGRRVLFYSGNDSAAKAEVAALIDRIGFVGIDLGSLAVGGKLAQFPGGPLPNQNLVKVA